MRYTVKGCRFDISMNSLWTVSSEKGYSLSCSSGSVMLLSSPVMFLLAPCASVPLATPNRSRRFLSGGLRDIKIRDIRDKRKRGEREKKGGGKQMTVKEKRKRTVRGFISIQANYGARLLDTRLSETLFHRKEALLILYVLLIGLLVMGRLLKIQPTELLSCLLNLIHHLSSWAMGSFQFLWLQCIRLGWDCSLMEICSFKKKWELTSTNY